MEIIKVDETSNEPLNGAIFTVEKQDGTRIGEYTTADGGMINIPTLDPDFYVVKEIKAPKGYVLDQTPQTVEVKTNAPTVVKFTNKKMTALQIIKTDEKTNEPLNGAVFTVEKQDGTRVGEYTTADGGMINIPTLAPDFYVVKEIKAPDGYIVDTTPKTVEVKTDIPTVVKFTNKKKTALQIKKVDEKSGKALVGAVFTVETQKGEPVYTNENGTEFTTDAQGFINIPTLAPGFYVVKEIKAPDGYILDQTPKTVEVKTDSPTVVTFTNKYKSGLQIIKVDADTNEPLSGAKFTIYKKSGDIVGTYTTDANGVIIVDQLDNGWYKLAETQAPKGYLLDEEPKDIEIKGNDFHKIVFTNKKLTGILIKKMDDKSGAPLAGAKFKVTEHDGTTVGEFSTAQDGTINVPNLKPGIYIVSEVKSPDGYFLDETPKNVEVMSGKVAEITFTNKKLTSLQIKKIDEKSGKALAGAVFTIEKQNGEKVQTNENGTEFVTDAQGFINIPTLTPGFYVVKEVKAPDGYILDQTPKTVEVKTDAPTVVTFTNKYKSGLQIIKVDADTNEPLSGAKFTIYKKSGEIVGTYTTDANGVIIVDQLDNGWYKLAETKAPDGYKIEEEPKDIEIKGNDFHKVVFTNKKLASLQIKKIDGVTGKALAGARFVIEKQNGEKIFTGENGTEWVTDAQGFINIPQLAPDYYVVRETQAPDGYILDETPKTVQVKTTTPTIVTFENKPLAGLKIVKLDSESRKPLEGVQFSITKMNGERISNDFNTDIFKTDKNGTIYLSNLENGYYQVREVKALDGYFLDAEPKQVLVESGKAALLEVLNKPASGLLIVKTDAMTGKPLQGVVFDVKRADGQRVQGTILDQNQLNTDNNSPNKNVGMNGDVAGSYVTDANGRILINHLQPGEYHVIETKQLPGYELDTKVYNVTVEQGKQAVVKVVNKQLAGLRIKKIDSITKQPIFNVEFMVEDSNGKVVGKFYTDNNGMIDLSAILVEGRYTLRETRPAEGYFRDDVPRTVEFISGKMTEVVWENKPEAGQIQITKLSADDNEVNGLPAGTPLEGAIFEVYAYKSGNLVDRFITGYDGKGVSKPLPKGRYKIKEVQAPPYYKVNPKELDIEIEFATQIVKLDFVNESANTGVSIDKVGPKETMAGSDIKYDIKRVRNDSSVALTDFYWRDVLPVDAMRVTKLHTGTYNQSVKYKILATTNKGNTITVADNLMTTKNNIIGLTNAELGLPNDEFVTSFTLYFGNVKAGFSSVDMPQVYGTVMKKSLPNGYTFANKVDVGGKYQGEWIIGNSTWATVIYNPTADKLPKTGK